MNTLTSNNRLNGLDLARYLAFIGMVVVNFKVVMGVGETDGLLNLFTNAIEGKAAATFVVLAGVGLGLAGLKSVDKTISLTIKRSAFLLVVGLLNTLIFSADIIHYYAFYFLLGALMLSASDRVLVVTIVMLNIVFVTLLLTLNYDAGWNWVNYSYSGFWTSKGFVRNLFFNGWHPVIPWLGFLLFGMLLSRLELGNRSTQIKLTVYGFGVLLFAEFMSVTMVPMLSAIDVDLISIASTHPIPPMPLYSMSGMGAATFVIGLCLLLSDLATKIGIMQFVTPAGRQTLTLYIAHIFIGMGILDGLGMLGKQSITTAIIAAGLFCLIATVYAWLWSRYMQRGPIEHLMRKIAG